MFPADGHRRVHMPMNVGTRDVPEQWNAVKVGSCQPLCGRTLPATIDSIYLAIQRGARNF